MGLGFEFPVSSAQVSVTEFIGVGVGLCEFTETKGRPAISV